MTVKDMMKGAETAAEGMIREVSEATEGMILPKHTDEIAAEVKEKVGDIIQEIGEASDQMLGMDSAIVDATEKLGQMAKEVGDAADTMIPLKNPKK